MMSPNIRFVISAQAAIYSAYTPSRVASSI